ncbi:MAG TPA: hypothetical protein VFG19_10120 [Geobacteraceae bacterium]|nr:hypothetical protein [Geobacteraceae bacterium]
MTVDNMYNGTDELFLRMISCSDITEQSSGRIESFVTDEIFEIWRKYSSGLEMQIGELWVQKLDLTKALHAGISLFEFHKLSPAVRAVMEGLFDIRSCSHRLKEEVDWPANRQSIPHGLLHVNSIFVIEGERHKQAVGRTLKLLVNFHVAKYLTCLFVRAYSDNSARRTKLDWGELPRTVSSKDAVSQIIRGLYRCGLRPIGGKPQVMYLPRAIQSVWMSGIAA